MDDRKARMHTAEHILNAVMQRDFSTGRSVVAHLGERKSKCDYVLPRSLSASEVRQIEAAVNAEIEADHAVTWRVIPRAAAEASLDMSKVPQNADEIRVVNIDALDEIPCVGGHVEHTSCVGRFTLRSVERRDQKIVRIRFTLSE